MGTTKDEGVEFGESYLHKFAEESSKLECAYREFELVSEIKMV